MSKVVSVRLPDDLADWLDAYAEERGISRQKVVEGAVANLREDARRGIPELPPDEPVPSPADTGTESWPDPTEAELERARAEHPDLPEDRLWRLARAQHQLDHQRSSADWPRAAAVAQGQASRGTIGGGGRG